MNTCSPCSPSPLHTIAGVQDMCRVQKHASRMPPTLAPASPKLGFMHVKLFASLPTRLVLTPDFLVSTPFPFHPTRIHGHTG